MPFSTVQGEDLRKELRIEYRGGGLFFTPSTTVRLTNRQGVSQIRDLTGGGSDTTSIDDFMAELEAARQQCVNC